MNRWVITYLIMEILGLGIILGRHGKPREENYNRYL